MKKGSIYTILLILVLLVGFSLLLYPTVSDYFNKLHQSRLVVEYVEQVANLDNEVYDRLLTEAAAYNARLTKKENQYVMTEDDLTEYYALLDISGNGVIGYIEIASIDVSLPIYHGTDESALQTAACHIEWTSLPIGGIGTHSVISGHRGLPSARLFTDLDRLNEGDTFVLRVLDETVTYEVDQILIVLPEDVEELQIDAENDYCTLVTCTPYGINSHRLLVRGHRVENAQESKMIRVTSDAIQIDPIIMAPLVATPMLLILLIWLFIPHKKEKD